MSDLSAADIESLRDLIDAVTPGLLPLSCDQASLSQMRMTGAPIEYVVADANGLEFATVRNQDEETTDLIVRAINALPALLDAVEKLDRATDLFEKWAAEESEHRAAGEYGIAEGLHVAIEELRYAVHGTYEKPYPDGLRERQREPEEPADEPHRIDVTHVASGELERMARSGARPSPELRAAIDRARDRKGADRG